MANMYLIAVSLLFTFLTSLGFLAEAHAQDNNYQVITVSNGGTIRGTVKWSGPVPKDLSFPITKDPQICDPDNTKRADLERLVIGSDGGVANTVVFLKNIHSGKALDVESAKPTLDQKHCRYEPHVMLVPRTAQLQMKSSDATLHTIHMEGAATYNLPFPFVDKVSARPLNNSGLVSLRCNGGHVWMNAEIYVIDHPYYAVTDTSGRFELTDVPPGQYQIEAWHEGWGIAGHQDSFDVLTEHKVARPVFTEPRTWDKPVTVSSSGSSVVNFTLSEK
jgi:hypothetical protein